MSVSSQISGRRLEARAVSKTYASEKGLVQALRPIDLTIEAGEFVSVVGPSGCGKSTLMLIMAGLLPSTAGEVLVDSTQLTGPLTEVGIVFQDHLLLDFRTALANVLLQAQIRSIPPQQAEAEANRLFDRLGLEGTQDRYPNQLSGGMRQRVSLARALIHDPPVLLMDEPFGALDALTRTQMRHDLEQIWMEQRKTVMFITHSVEEAVGLSDRVLIMSPGPGEVVDDLIIDLPRPRPLALGKSANFADYSDYIYGRFSELGVLEA